MADENAEKTNSETTSETTETTTTTSETTKHSHPGTAGESKVLDTPDGPKTEGVNYDATAGTMSVDNPTIHKGEGDPHIVTQQDIDDNPDLVAAEVKVGDTIFLPKGKSIPQMFEEAKSESSEIVSETTTSETTNANAENSVDPNANQQHDEPGVIYQITVTANSLKITFDAHEKTSLPALSEKEVIKTIGKVDHLGLTYEIEKELDEKKTAEIGFAVILKDLDSQIRIPEKGFYQLLPDFSKPVA